MKDLDKSIYLLNHSERLDAEGRIDAAAKAREDASKIVMDQKEKLVTFGIKRMELEQTAQLAREKIASDEKRTAMVAGARGNGGQMTENQKVVANDKASRLATNELKKDIDYNTEPDPIKKQAMYATVFKKHLQNIYGTYTSTALDTIGDGPTAELTYNPETGKVE